MTGWGRAAFSIGREAFIVEVKSLNHRFIEINARMPERFSIFELRARDVVKKRFSRGAFYLTVTPEGVEEPEFKVNMALARAYLKAADDIKRELGVSGGVDAAFLLKIRDIYSSGGPGTMEEGLEKFEAGLSSALDELEAWRAREGEAITEDLSSRVSTVARLVSDIEALVPASVEAQRRRLKAEIERLAGALADEARLAMEAAMLAERADVSEEVSRLKSHISMFRGYLGLKEPAGKRLDFLCQEILRETNTIGSKSADVRITGTVVELKGEIEKIREQVQNVE
jgi:uncharacterized protein (TIGR00255 family)